nr:4-carboxy-4-hydroxy-2-oxoadipate aldolase/oxaloacetate decarboxylase [uncultured Oscillibacter sp.]
MEQIIYDIERADPQKIEELKKYGSATVHEAIGRKGAMYARMNPLGPGMKCCGSAITVKMQAGDNLTLLKALDVAKVGDVLVVDNGNLEDEGPWGEIMSIAAQLKGIAGLVIDGCVRDSGEIKEMGFPVFCVGTCIIGTVKESVGLINHPITCGRAMVNPGDVILADEDGVVVVSRDEIDYAIELSQKRTEKEKRQVERLKTGESLLHIANLDQLLTQKGF